MRYVITITLIVLLSCCLNNVFGQGCSDPGICTSGALNSANTQDSTSKIDFTTASMEELLGASIAAEKHKFGVDFAYGIGDKRTNVYNLILRYSIRIKERMLFNVKMPFAYIQGDIGKTGGTGDLTLTMQNTFKSGRNVNMAYTLGVIIPTNDASLDYKGEAMPMVYQSSLGFFNAIVGYSIKYKKWSSVIGYQHSFGSNSNEFIKKGISVDSSSVDFSKQFDRKHYNSSRKLSRGGDLIFRLERGFQIKSLNLAIGVLPILRLGESTYEDESGQIISVEGSDGLTLNLTAGATYHTSKSTFIKINFGGPVIKREKGPDGLLRDFVMILGVGVKMW